LCLMIILCGRYVKRMRRSASVLKELMRYEVNSEVKEAREIIKEMFAGETSSGTIAVCNRTPKMPGTVTKGVTVPWGEKIILLDFALFCVYSCRGGHYG
jgi:hypothetical protein